MASRNRGRLQCRTMPANSEAAPSTKVDVRNVRQRRFASLGIMGASLALALLSVVAFPAVGFAAGIGWGVLASIAAMMTGIYSLATADNGPGERRCVAGAVAIEDGRLHVTKRSSTSIHALSDLVDGWSERSEQGPVAVMKFANGDEVSVACDTEQRAAELLLAAGAQERAHAVRMCTYREDASGRKIAGFFLAFFSVFVAPSFLAVPAILLLAATSSHATVGQAMMVCLGFAPLGLLLAWLAGKVWPTWIHVGSDGILIRGGVRNRFLPFRKLKTVVEATALGLLGPRSCLRFELTDGKSVSIPVLGNERARVTIERIEEARREMSKRGRARVLADIGRQGRSLSEWRKALGEILKPAGYRAASHDLQEVIDIAEDPGALPEQRVAAALVAKQNADPSVHKRLRVAAETCVEPKLRVALEKAACGEVDDEVLEEVSAASRTASE